MHKYKNIRDESELLKKQLSRIFVAVPAVEWDEALEAAVFFGSSLLIMHIKTSQGKKDTKEPEHKENRNEDKNSHTWLVEKKEILLSALSP